MSKCKLCKENDVIRDDTILDDMNIQRINKKGTRFPLKNNSNERYQLWKCLDCNTYWETRPLYKETMYGGEPNEWVKVSEEYVKKYYPEVIDDQYS